MQKTDARKWYSWLWLSPIFTIPTLFVLAIVASFTDFRIATAIGISALWHLILLIPALNRKRPFVRWHGRQAILLACVRTAIPLLFVAVSGETFEALCAIPFLIVVWLLGTLWGQRQAACGDCSLLRWFGSDEADEILSGVKRESDEITLDRTTKDLVRTIRFGRFSAQRKAALAELDALDMVEVL